MLPDVVSELLDRLFGPLFDSTQELALVSLVEIFNRLFKFDLSSA